MAWSWLGLPLDQSGKKLRTRSRTINADTVHEQYTVISPHDRIITISPYVYDTGSLVIAVGADAANVGRIYIANAPASGILIAITKVWFRSQLASALVTVTSPRIQLKRYSFTGTPSGTALTGAKMVTTMNNKSSTWEVRSAATGQTITEGAVVHTFYPTANATAVGQAPPAVSEWVPPDPAIPFILQGGEGMMLKQADAGTTSDTRLFNCSFYIEEFQPES